MKKQEAYLLIKFGCIKGGYYIDNPEALELSNKLNKAESDAERKNIECQIIDVFNGDLYGWWDQRNLTKQEAKDYIMEYAT